MPDAADGDERAVVLQAARRNNGGCNLGRGGRRLEGIQRFDDQIGRRRVHDLVEDSEVDGGNMFGIRRISLHDLAQNIFHDFVEMVLGERRGERLVAPLDVVRQVGQLRR